MFEHRKPTFLLTEFDRYILQENGRGIYLENTQYIDTTWTERPNI